MTTPDGRAPGGAGDLFLVDDNPANLSLLTRILREAGFQVRMANSGRRALAAVRAQPPELVLLDVTMPDLDGYAVCAQLKADPATRDLPVIFLSALDGTSDKLDAFRAGGVDYVTKPFQAEEVLARVRTQLDLYRARRALQQKHAELERERAELLAARANADQIFAALSDVLAGTVLDGRYRLEERIGTGGSAAVYRAVDLGAAGGRVAIKVLRPRPDRAPAELREQAEAEWRSSGRLGHPGAVQVLATGTTGAGISYVVMELLSGRTLAAELTACGRLTFARAARIFTVAADVLAAAHRAGVVHRDVKPENLFLHVATPGEEVVKVLDFGLARLREPSRLDPGTAPGDPTHTLGLHGTPVFMAPEQLLGQRFDGRADVYGLAVTLYLAVAGVLPFRLPRGLGATIVACVQAPPMPLGQVRPDAPAELEALLARALAKTAAERPTMAELAVRLPDLLKVASEEAAGTGADPSGAALEETVDVNRL